MKLHLPKSLLAAILALAFVVGSNRAEALTITSELTYDSFSTAQNSGDSLPSGVTYDAVTGVLTGIPTTNVWFKLDYSTLPNGAATDGNQHVIYVTNTNYPSNKTQCYWGINTNNSGALSGYWQVTGNTGDQADNYTWTDKDNEANSIVDEKTKLQALAPENSTKVILNASIGDGGTYLYDSEGNKVYDASNLLTADGDVAPALTINNSYITDILYNVALSATVSNASGWTKEYDNVVLNATVAYDVDATIIDKGVLTVGGGSANANQNNLSRDTDANVTGKQVCDIIVGGSGQLFLQTYPNGAISLDNDIYLGTSENTNGALSVAAYSGTIDLSGNITLVEDSKITKETNKDNKNNLVSFIGNVSDGEGDNYTLTLSADSSGGKLDYVSFKGNVDLGGLNLASASGSDVAFSNAEADKTIQIGTLTLGGANHKLTLDETTSISKLVMTNGASLTLAGSSTNNTISAVTATNNGNNSITLESGATLKRIDSVTGGAVTLKGNGIYDLGAVDKGGANAILGNNLELGTDSTWTGMVSLSGGEFRDCTNGQSSVNTYCVQSINFNALGRSGSTVEIAEGGLYGYLSVSGNSTGTYDPNIKLTGDLTIQNGNGGANIIFAGKISGGGDMVLARYGGGTNSYTFQNDISGWTGNLISQDNSSQNDIIHNVILTGAATTVKAGIDLQGETLNLTVNNTGKTTTFANNVKVTAFHAQAGDVVLAKDKSLTAGTIKVGANAEAPTLKVTGADGSNAAKLTGATEVGGKIQQTTSGITVSNMTLANVKLTGANVNTAIALQDVAGAATLATGTYTVAAVAGAAPAAAENVALSYTLGGLTGLTLDNADTKLVINTGDVLAAVGDAESFTLSFNLGDGISLYDSEWTPEALAGVITFGGALGEWLSGSETQYTLASDAVATASLDGLVPTVTYAMTDGVLTSISISGNIPEPTTATLSLLALAALAARRRK
ncbi:MAG: hypothetical protein IJN29_11165 [Akkermansia sp.]|nr:hypothetical protein [Akkermansia sp.]